MAGQMAGKGQLGFRKWGRFSILSVSCWEWGCAVMVEAVVGFGLCGELFPLRQKRRPAVARAWVWAVM